MLVLTSPPISCLKTTEVYYEESHCLVTETDTFLADISGPASERIGLDSFSSVLSLYRDITNIEIRELEVKEPNDENIAKLKFVASKNWFTAVGIGQIIEISDWDEYYSQRLTSSQRAITRFLTCHNNLSTVCTLNDENYFTQVECDRQREAMTNVYNLQPPSLREGTTLALDGNQKVKFMTTKEMDKNEEDFEFVTRSSETSEVFFDMKKDAENYLRSLHGQLKLFHHKTNYSVADPCFPDNMIFSALVESSAPTAEREDFCLKLKEVVGTQPSSPPPSSSSHGRR